MSEESWREYERRGKTFRVQAVGSSLIRVQYKEWDGSVNNHRGSWGYTEGGLRGSAGGGWREHLDRVCDALLEREEQELRRKKAAEEKRVRDEATAVDIEAFLDSLPISDGSDRDSSLY